MTRVLFTLFLCACDSGTNTTTDDLGTSECALSARTTATSTVTKNCALLTRDTSGCAATRMAAGLSGFWIKFSCRVTLSRTSTHVQVLTDSQPDYASNYFATSDKCYTAAMGTVQNPNRIAATNMTLHVPIVPSGNEQMMTGAVVGVALNGVPIFANFAAPGDDIFSEAMTFDSCQGHPQMTGLYHYHSEPYSISADDSKLIGVMRDGNPIYGRRDMDGSLPTLDTAGGHTGPTADSINDVYHYHVNQQTSTDPRTIGQMQWFLTKGRYHSNPGSCTGC